MRGSTAWEWQIGFLYFKIRFPRFWRSVGIISGGIDNYSTHTLYKRTDKDAPEVVKEYDLGVCRKCGRSECQLGEACWKKRNK